MSAVRDSFTEKTSAYASFAADRTIGAVYGTEGAVGCVIWRK